MSRASTMIVEKIAGEGATVYPVSLGYDRVRFLKPAFIGDTITVTYAVARIDEVKQRTTATVEVLNEAGDVVAAATHIMKWLPRSST